MVVKKINKILTRKIYDDSDAILNNLATMIKRQITQVENCISFEFNLSEFKDGF